jgi:nicotinic acetylcholine receptor beta-1
MYVDGATNANVRRLNSLLAGYRKDVRPAVNMTEATQVDVVMNLVAIQDLDEVENKLSTVVAFSIQWDDHRMAWDPDTNGGATSVLFPQSDVCIPPLIQSRPPTSIDTLGNDMIQVRYTANGRASWSPGTVLKSICGIDITYYPFDIQTCEMMFIPWGFTPSEVLLNTPIEMIGLQYYSEGGEWLLSNARAISGINSGEFSFATFILTLERRSTFLVVNIISPVILMAALNCLVFVLPTKSGERVSYSITVLLSIAVFLTMIGDNIPKTSKPM